MTEYETFIRAAATARGIDPDTAIKVARSEGGVDEPARRGTFDTGSSWWAFQLHYGGAGYERFGTIAGMGNSFTKLTGWQPGDPRAWKDAARYALNRVKASGWGAWYGAAAVGVNQWDGIDRAHPWAASSERWDYESGVTPMPAPTYNLALPIRTQDHDWDCFQESANWALHAAGRNPSNDWLERQMLADGIESTARGLEDGSGAQAAAWITRQYGSPADGTPTITAHNVAAILFDEVRASAGSYPILIGGHGWGAAGHWVGVRRYDAQQGTLVLANPGGTGPVYGQQTLDRQQFAERGPWSAVILLADGVTAPPPAVPEPERDTAELRRLFDEIAERVERARVLTGV